MFNRLANSSIKKKIAALKPETKRKFLTTGIITVFILLSLLAYNERQGDAVAADKGEPSGKEEFKRLNYDSDVIEKTFQDNLTANLEQETADLAAKDQQRDKEWQEKMRALAALEERLERKIESDPVILSPPVPQYGHGMATVAEAETDKREQPPQPVGMFEPIGGIELNPQKIEEKTENDAGKKKNTVFLPANSFVKATLLHGLSANTTKGGKDDHQTLVIPHQ